MRVGGLRHWLLANASGPLQVSADVRSSTLERVDAIDQAKGSKEDVAASGTHDIVQRQSGVLL